MKNIIKGIAICLSLAGCTSIPDYATPTASIPEQWHAVTPHAGNSANMKDWWSQFNDPTLLQVLEQAEAHSPTLQASMARIAQARANEALVGAPKYPAVSFGSASTQRGDTRLDTRIQTDTTNLTFSWEADLFNKYKLNQESATAQVESKTLEWHDAKILLASEVAETYFNRKICLKIQEIQNKDLESRSSTKRITQSRTKYGFTSPLDLNRATASEAEAKAQIQVSSVLCSANLNKLAYLTGMPPSVLDNLIPATELDSITVPFVFAPLPAVSIRQRPDVQASEKAVQSAWLNVKYTETLNKPNFSLSGFIGTSLTQGGITLQPWQFAINMLMPILDGGANNAKVDMAEAKYAESVALYQNKVRGAIRETEDALSRTQGAILRKKEAEVSQQEYSKFFKGQEVRYRAGASSLLELEDARRVYLQSQQAYLTATQESINSWITLYRATGGDFNAH